MPRDSRRLPMLFTAALLMSFSLVFLASLVFPASSVRSAGADVVPPGQRNISVEHVVDLGPYRDFTSRAYTVRKGDTLSQIAQRELGSLRRMPEILAANGLKKNSIIKAGDALVLPPRRQPATKEALAQGLAEKDAKPWFDFYVVPDASIRGELLPFPANGRLPRGNYHVMVVAVPHAKAAEFEKAFEKAGDKDWKTLKGLLENSWVYETGRLSCRDSVPTSSPVRVRRHDWKVSSVKDGKLTLTKVKVATLDQAGEPVSESSPQRNAVFFFLSFVGLFGLYALWRSRRPNEMVVKVEG